MSRSGIEIADDWMGLEKEKARRLRQACCQLRLRPFYAKPNNDGLIPTIPAMTCAIIDRLQEISGAPKGGLAHILGVQASEVSHLLNDKKWPPRAPRPHFALGKVATWIILGGQARTSELDADPVKRNILVDIAHDIQKYFFPRGHEGIEGTPYFSAERLVRDQPFDQPELRLIIEWLRRQIKLERCPGQLVIVAPTAEALDVFSENRIREELAMTAVQSEHLKVSLFTSGAEVAKKLAESIRTRGSILKSAGEPEHKLRTGEGLRVITLPKNDPLNHPIFGFVYLAYGPSIGDAVQERKVRGLVLRPFGGGQGGTPLTFTTTKAERANIVQWIKRHDHHVLEESQQRATE